MGYQLSYVAMWELSYVGISLPTELIAHSIKLNFARIVCFSEFLFRGVLPRTPLRGSAPDPPPVYHPRQALLSGRYPGQTGYKRDKNRHT